MSRLSWHEAKILRAARDLMQEKPDETLAYLSGDVAVTPEHLISLALRAQLEQTKQAQQAMKVTVALANFLKGETNEATND